jgi:hypothetical protein
MGAIAGSQENKLHLDETRAGTAAERIFLVQSISLHHAQSNPPFGGSFPADRFRRNLSHFWGIVPGS